MRIFKITGLQKLTLQLCITGFKHYHFVWNDKMADKKMRFERESDNPNDTNAIKVYLDDTMIGYISANDSRDLAPIMDTHQNLQPYRWIRINECSNDGYMIIHLRMKPI